jgi:hypothetical protein
MVALTFKASDEGTEGAAPQSIRKSSIGNRQSVILNPQSPV